MRILICEDEPLVRARLHRLCEEYLTTQEANYPGPIAGTEQTKGSSSPRAPLARFDVVANLEDAHARLEKTVYDGLLLDLNLEGEDGFELLKRSTAGRYHCVVVSAHRERALEAFAYGVLDFVAKPFTRERLYLALARLLQVSEYRSGALRYLGVWRAQGVASIAVDQVRWMRAEAAMTELCLGQDRFELHEKSLTALLQLLPDDFVRCHRSYVVNLRYVASLHSAPGSRYWLKLSDGKELPVGRSMVAALRARFV